MSIKHVKGDILTTPTRNEDTVICHQVNCCGVMGAGLAKQIRDKWPVVFDEYKKICGTDRLGDSQTVQVAPQLYVANLFGQLNYGRDKRQTNYAALAAAIFGENSSGNVMRILSGPVNSLKLWRVTSVFRAVVRMLILWAKCSAEMMSR